MGSDKGKKKRASAKTEINLQRSRNWCFTINNPTYNDVEALHQIFDIKNDYLIIAFETGESGTDHIQGFIHFGITARSGCVLKKYFPRAKIFKCVGSIQSNINYCKKGEQPKDEYDKMKTKGPNYGLNAEFVEQGVKPKGQGKRSDLLAVQEDIDEGLSVSEISEKHFSTFIRYNKGIEKYMAAHMQHRTEMPEVYWFYGTTGSGKSRTAIELAYKFGYDYYIKDSSHKWWDGYMQQPVVIIDDYEYKPGVMSFKYLLRLLDRYRLSVEVKGGTIPFNSEIIIFTCDKPPTDIFKREVASSEYSQLQRRIFEIREFGEYSRVKAVYNDYGEDMTMRGRDLPLIMRKLMRDREVSENDIIEV